VKRGGRGARFGRGARYVARGDGFSPSCVDDPGIKGRKDRGGIGFIDVPRSSAARHTGRKLRDREIAYEKYIAAQAFMSFGCPGLLDEQRQQGTCVQVQAQ